jgi:hypothetical protein
MDQQLVNPNAPVRNPPLSGQFEQIAELQKNLNFGAAQGIQCLKNAELPLFLCNWCGLQQWAIKVATM